MKKNLVRDRGRGGLWLGGASTARYRALPLPRYRALSIHLVRYLIILV